MTASMTGCRIVRCMAAATDELASIPLCGRHFGRLLAAARLAEHSGLRIRRSGEPIDCRVYFARIGDYIKIGRSDDVHHRVRSLHHEGGSLRKPADLPQGVRAELLASMPASHLDERRVHDHFVTARVVGEWFRATPELLAYIDTLQPTAVPA